MTDPTGLSFVSYRRSRAGECTRLVAALRERGIPTWRDVDDLNTEPTETELRRVLGDDSVASAILWISPETADSSIIRKVEAPVALDRHSRQGRLLLRRTGGRRRTGVRGSSGGDQNRHQHH